MLQNSIEFVRCNGSKSLAPELMAQLFDCYPPIYAEAPWFEWKKCSVSKRQWGTVHQEELALTDFMHCGEPLVEFWPRATVESDLKEAMDASGASFWLALQGNRLVGFCYGYAKTPEKLEEQMERPGLALAVKEKFGASVRYVAYQADIALIPEFRGRHLASQMFELRRKDFLAQGMQIGVVRVKMDPPSVTYLWYTTKLGYEVISEYHDAGKRVLLARSL